MKVLLVNGGPHPKGCTNRALEEVEKALKEKIIILEKLDPSDKNFTAKLNNFYSLQIKALKIA